MLGGITLPPNYGADYIRQFNDTYAMLGQAVSCAAAPFLLQDVYGVPGSMQADGIHATAQGNQQVARNLLPLLIRCSISLNAQRHPITVSNHYERLKHRAGNTLRDADEFVPAREYLDVRGGGKVSQVAHRAIPHTACRVGIRCGRRVTPAAACADAADAAPASPASVSVASSSSEARRSANGPAATRRSDAKMRRRSPSADLDRAPANGYIRLQKQLRRNAGCLLRQK